MNRTQIAYVAFTGLAGAAALGNPLQQAKIDKIINDVRVMDPATGFHPAHLEEAVKNDLAVRTGVQSRAELRFQDNTLTRLGAETLFSFKEGTREIRLGQGTMLLQVPKQIGGAQIHAASITASVTGTTIMVEFVPGQNFKAIVLEGSLRISLDHEVGQSVLLTPGKMLMMKPGGRSIPEPVDVDLKRLVATSALINPKTFAGKTKTPVAILPSMPLINNAIASQAESKGQSALVDTNLVILGKGSTLTVATNQLLGQIDQGVLPEPLSAAPGPSPIQRVQGSLGSQGIPSSTKGGATSGVQPVAGGVANSKGHGANNSGANLVSAVNGFLNGNGNGGNGEGNGDNGKGNSNKGGNNGNGGNGNGQGDNGNGNGNSNGENGNGNGNGNGNSRNYGSSNVQSANRAALSQRVSAGAGAPRIENSSQLVSLLSAAPQSPGSRITFNSLPGGAAPNTGVPANGLPVARKGLPTPDSSGKMLSEHRAVNGSNLKP